jgi:hypothetical protein
MELAVDGAEGGFNVDDTLPWETWHLDGPRGVFRFVCAIFDRSETGGQLETRISMHVQVRPSAVNAP